MFRQRGPRLAHNNVEQRLFRLARQLGVFDFADALRNYPVHRWQDLFTYLATIKSEIYLSLTGGEPLILEEPIVEIVNHLHQKFDRVLVRFDTNGSIVPTFAGLDPRAEISFNVSYHPSQIKRDKLLSNLDLLRKKGRVLMVNRVFGKRDLSAVLDEVTYFADRGYFLNFAPQDFDIAEYDEADLTLIEKLRSPIDFEYPLLEKTVGRQCSFPTFGFQLLPNGYAWIPPCDSKTADVINNPKRIHRLLKPEAIACPGKCVCFHQYPWSVDGYADADIMSEYVARNRKWRDQNLPSGTIASNPAPTIG
jgi:organic radical activating enzyme